jgi:hypothetical protein
MPKRVRNPTDRLLTADWEPAFSERPERGPDGLLWKATHPIGETVGATRFIGTTAISSAQPSAGTLTVPYHRVPGRPI